MDARRPVLPALLLVLVMGATACGREARQEAGAGAKAIVYATNYPTTYFIQRLAGELVEVVCPVPPGAPPTFGSPADETDGPYPWLDPNLAKRQATEIAMSLRHRFPAHTGAIDARLQVLLTDLDGLHAGFEALASPTVSEPLLASRPSYDQVASRYGWTIRTLELDPTTMPSPVQVAALEKALDATGARFLLWHAEPRPEVVKHLREELALASVTFHALETLSEAQREAKEDYLSVMRANLARLTPVFHGKRIFETTLRGVYRALEHESEVETYDALSRSVENDLVSDVYLAIRAGVQRASAEEGRASVPEVEVVEVVEARVYLPWGADGLEFDVHARWRVSQVTELAGTFALRRTDEAWRIARMEILEEKSVGDEAD